MRLYQAYNPAFVITPDTTYLRYRGRPCSDEFNGFKLNSRGYKDTEFSEWKERGRFRILAIGDSQTYGAVPYQDSYMTLVEKKLQSAHAESEIFNMGIPSAGPVDYLSVLAEEGFNLNPDMILINFNIFDDFNNGGKRFKLYSYSAAASFINSCIFRVMKPKGAVFSAGLYREGFPLRSDESYERLVMNSHGTVFQKKNRSFFMDFQSSFAYLQKIHRLCRIKNIPLVIVIIPADLQLYFFLQKKAYIALNATEDDFDFRLPNRMLAAEFTRLGIPYLDLLDYFLPELEKTGKSATQGNDPHWNRFGSRIAAESVSPWLIRQVIRQLRASK